MNDLTTQLGKAMAAATGGEVRKPTGSAEMTKEQSGAVAYFYARLSTIYGPEYMRNFPDEKTEAISKREHGAYIMDFTKDQIDKGMDALHTSRQYGEEQYKWLNVDEVIGLVRSGGNITGDRVGAYKVFPRSHRLEDQTAKYKRKQEGRKHCEALKGLFGDD